MKRDWE